MLRDRMWHAHRDRVLRLRASWLAVNSKHGGEDEPRQQTTSSDQHYIFMNPNIVDPRRAPEPNSVLQQYAGLPTGSLQTTLCLSVFILVIPVQNSSGMV